MFKIANEPPPDIRSVNPHISAELAAVVASALAKSLDVRFATGQIMADALEKCLNANPVQQTETQTLDAEEISRAVQAQQPASGQTKEFATTVVLTNHTDGGQTPSQP